MGDIWSGITSLIFECGYCVKNYEFSAILFQSVLMNLVTVAMQIFG
jgi:hypothetical protein